MRTVTILIVLLFSEIVFLYGQPDSKRYDSLRNLLETANDTVKLQVYNKLCWENRSIRQVEAFEYGIAGLNLSLKTNNQSFAASFYNKIGVLYRNIQLYDRAIENFEQAYKIAYSVDNKTEIAYALNNLGDILNRKGQYAEAEKSINEALKIFSDKADLRGTVYCYHQLSILYKNKKSYAQAENFQRKVVALRSQLKDSDGIAGSYQVIAEIYLEQNRIEDARKMVQNKVNIVKSLKMFPQLSSAYVFLGDTWLKNDHIDSALYYFHAGLQIATEYDVYETASEAAWQISQIYNVSKDYQNALQYFSVYKSFSDSLDKYSYEFQYNQIDMASNFNRKFQNLEIEMIRKNEAMKSKVKTREYVIYTFVLVLVIVFIFLFIIVKSFRINKAQNLQLKLQKSQIINKNQELMAQANEILAQNEEIIKQRDELSLANMTKNRFFSIIGHDLRNPFNTILGFSELLSENLSESNRENNILYINYIKSSANTAYELLENLLIWAQTQTNAIAFNPEKLNISLVIAENIVFLSAQALKKNINLTSDTSNKAFVYADRNMLDTIIRNLVSNAIKFTAENKQIFIGSSVKNNECIIEVKDEGVGIAPENISKLFRVDQKVSTEGTNNEKGTGIGLVLCKEFVDKHNGKIYVESTLGKGSTFYVALPLV